MKITLELDEINMQLIQKAIQYCDSHFIVNRIRLLEYAVIMQLKDRASKRLIRLEPGKHKFYLSELLVLETLLGQLPIDNQIEDNFRNVLAGKINTLIYANQFIG